MINGYSNPYDIFREESSLSLFSDIRTNVNCGIIPEAKTENVELPVKIVEHFLGTGMISSFFEWTGSYVMKSYYNLCQRYIEEEFDVIRNKESSIDDELRMSFVLFAGVGKWLDIVEYKSGELRNSIKLSIRALLNFSLSKAIADSIEEDIASGKYSRWFEFALSSFICLLAHCWKVMPNSRSILDNYAELAIRPAIDGIMSIDSLFTYQYSSNLLDCSILYYYQYHISEIRIFGSENSSLAIRKELVDDLVESSSTIVSDFKNRT